MKCSVSYHEPLLLKLVAAIFAADGLLPDGAVVDCGAHQGGESCFYAQLDPRRIVHAVEPLPQNRKVIHSIALPNIRTLAGALGSVDRHVLLDAPEQGRSHKSKQVEMLGGVHRAKSATGKGQGGQTFHVRRLDDLFATDWASERLAFAHFECAAHSNQLPSVRSLQLTFPLHRAASKAQRPTSSRERRTPFGETGPSSWWKPTCRSRVS